MKTVYFVRHGESEANVAPVFQGPNSPLSPTGIEQAHAVAERVSKFEFDVLLSSPFARARATAEIIAEKTGKTPEYSDVFVERLKPTSIDEKPYTDEVANTIWRSWEASLHTPGLRVEDGENYEDVVARADRALALLAARAEDTALVVTHGYFLRSIIARVLLRDTLTAASFLNIQRSANMQNTGITVLRVEQGFESAPAWKLWIYNDHAHLG
mgnify:CR=1 FL=1